MVLHVDVFLAFSLILWHRRVGGYAIDILYDFTTEDLLSIFSQHSFTYCATLISH